jgi:iron(III) transport system ATP-binding protein
MIDGRVRHTGTPREVYTMPVDRAVGAFIGEANFLPGEVRGARAECELGTFAVRATFEGRGDVMVRAEDIVIVEQAGTWAEVVSVEYYGHDVLATLRLPSGLPVRVRRSINIDLAPGQHVGLLVSGEAVAFPAT